MARRLRNLSRTATAFRHGLGARREERALDPGVLEAALLDLREEARARGAFSG